MGLAVVEIENPEDYFRKEYEEMVKKNEFKKSGTTAAMYYLDPEERTITTANLGDSRVYLTIKDNSKKNEINDLITLKDECLNKEILNRPNFEMIIKKLDKMILV